MQLPPNRRTKLRWQSRVSEIAFTREELRRGSWAALLFLEAPSPAGAPSKGIMGGAPAVAGAPAAGGRPGSGGRRLSRMEASARADEEEGGL